jgi:hypothetical protein
MQPGKKKYSKPQLKVHGTIEQLTKDIYESGSADSFPDATDVLNPSPPLVP